MSKIYDINMTLSFRSLTFGNNCVDVIRFIHMEVIYTFESSEFNVSIFFFSLSEAGLDLI